jgi:hypothetical protein
MVSPTPWPQHDGYMVISTMISVYIIGVDATTAWTVLSVSLIQLLAQSSALVIVVLPMMAW